MAETTLCLENHSATGHEFPLRYVWVTSVSAFDLYMTQLVAEVGLRLIDRKPEAITHNLNQIGVPLNMVFSFGSLSPAEKLIFYREVILSAVRFTSFYKPDGVSLALSYIWTSPSKEKWKRIYKRLNEIRDYSGITEQGIREELSQIGDRRDLIAHSVDLQPGAVSPNPVIRSDAEKVISFIGDVANAIDNETEAQLT